MCVAVQKLNCDISVIIINGNNILFMTNFQPKCWLVCVWNKRLFGISGNTEVLKNVRITLLKAEIGFSEAFT